MDAPDLVTETIERLRKLDKSAAEITREIGQPDDVSESWVKMFRRGKIPNPGVRSFHRIVEYLDRSAA